MVVVRDGERIVEKLPDGVELLDSKHEDNDDAASDDGDHQQNDTVDRQQLGNSASLELNPRSADHTMTSKMIGATSDNTTQPETATLTATDRNTSHTVLYGVLKRSDNKLQYRLTKAKTVIGRSSTECDFVIPSKTLSTVHASIDIDPIKHRVSLTDLNSMNGTLVNKTRAIRSGTVRLKHGDTIKFGFDTMSYTLELSDEFRNKRSTLPPSVADAARPSEELLKRLQESRKELSQLMADQKKKLQGAGEGDISSLTFPTASGNLTVPMGQSMEDDSVSESDSANYPVHTLDSSLNEKPLQLNMDHQKKKPENQRYANSHEETLLDRTDGRSSKAVKDQNIVDLTERLRKIEKVLQLNSDSSPKEQKPKTPPVSQQKKKQQPTTESLIDEDYQLGLLVDSVYALSNNIARELQLKTREKDTSITDAPSEMVYKLEHAQSNLKRILRYHRSNEKAKLKTIEDTTSGTQKKTTPRGVKALTKEIGEDKELRYMGIERYASELENQLTEATFKIQRMEIALRREEYNKEHPLSDIDEHFMIQTMQDELLLKNQELEELRAEVVNLSTSMYSGVAKAKMQNAFLDQLQQLDKSRKIIFEFERKERLRAHEWHAVTNENAQLRKTVSDLQAVIHNQMTDVNVMLMKKEQKLNLWASKLAEVSNGGNEMRRRAAEFLVSQIREYEQNQNQYIGKMEELKRQTSFIEIANTELKVEISQLKDVLRSSDPNGLLAINQALKDKIQQNSIEGSMNRIVSLQKLNEKLLSQITYITDVESVLRSQIESLERRPTQFDQDSCINYLERLLQEKEAIISRHLSLGKERQSPMAMHQRHMRTVTPPPSSSNRALERQKALDDASRDVATVNRAKKLEKLRQRTEQEMLLSAAPDVTDSRDGNVPIVGLNNTNESRLPLHDDDDDADEDVVDYDNNRDIRNSAADTYLTDTDDDADGNVHDEPAELEDSHTPNVLNSLDTIQTASSFEAEREEEEE